MVKDLIVHRMQVVHKLTWPGKIPNDMMRDPVKLPQYYPEQFSFVVVRSAKENFYLVNVTEFSVQLLVKGSQHRQGVCVALTKDSFDFHFTTWKREEDEKYYNYHHKFSFRPDLVQFMRNNGQLPVFTVTDNVKLLQKQAKLKSDNAKLKNENEKLRAQLENFKK